MRLDCQNTLQDLKFCVYSRKHHTILQSAHIGMCLCSYKIYSLTCQKIYCHGKPEAKSKSSLPLSICHHGSKCATNQLG